MLDAAPATAQFSRPMRIGDDDIERYWRDGFVAVPGLFAPEEIAPLARACGTDPDLDGAVVAIADSAGRAQEVATWTDLGDDLLSAIPRIERLAGAAAALIGKPIYHWHSKLSMKRPGSAGRWDWHQDFGYWYHDGCLAPDMITCMIAVDPASRANGCVQLVKGSHALGRMDHGRVGEASGIDPDRLERVLETLEIVQCEMAPGDAVFFHCNTLHASGPNDSDRPRALLHCSYNAVENSPRALGQDHHLYRPLAVLPDDTIAAGRYGSVITGQTFLAPRPGNAANAYGYTVLRHPRADRPAHIIGR